jgi:hypothetical protein
LPVGNAEIETGGRHLQEELDQRRHLQEELEQRRQLQEEQRRYLPDELDQRRLLMLSTATAKFENDEI